MSKHDPYINKLIFSKYLIIKKIGKGSFGTVYQGVNTTTNEKIALKVEKREKNDPGTLENEELRLVYLQGEGIPKVYCYGNNLVHNLLVEEFTDQDWRNEGRKINNNIQRFEKLYDELEQILENAKDEESFDSQTIQTVEDGLKSIRSVQSNIRAMKDKIASANYNIEMLDQENPEENEEDQQQGQVVMNLMQNKEVLEQRGKALQEIHKTAALIKDTTDKMAQDLVQQGEVLDDVEQHVVKAEDNVNKAEKEINRADELSRGNTKRLACIIVIVVVAIGAVLAIVLSLVLK